MSFFDRKRFFMPMGLRDAALEVLISLAARDMCRVAEVDRNRAVSAWTRVKHLLAARSERQRRRMEDRQNKRIGLQ